MQHIVLGVTYIKLGISYMHCLHWHHINVYEQLSILISTEVVFFQFSTIKHIVCELWAHLPVSTLDILSKPQLMSVTQQISASLLSHYNNNNFRLEALILFTWCIHQSTDKYIREIVSCVCVRSCNILWWKILHLNTFSKVCTYSLYRRHCHFKYGKYSGDCIRTW